MSRFSVVRQGSAIASARTGVVCSIALGAMIWTGCGNKPAPEPTLRGSGSPPGDLTRAARAPVKSAACPTQPAASDTNKADWTKYADCLTPTTTCYLTQVSALVWQGSQANTILVKVGPNKLEIDLAAQNATEQQGKRPDLWRHVPSTLPASLSSTQPTAANAQIAVLEGSTVEANLGITTGVKWPDCTALGDPSQTVALSPKSITLTGSDGSNHILQDFTPGQSRTLVFPNLDVTLRDDGEQWPATITNIKVEGSIGSGSGSVDLLDERFVPRPQSLDFRSSPVNMSLTPNGVGRFK